MKEIVYHKDARAVSDFDAEEYAQQLLTCNSIETSNELVINWARVLVAEGTLKEDLQVRFINPWNGHEQVVPVNKRGRLSEYPHGCCDEHMRSLERLLRNV